MQKGFVPVLIAIIAAVTLGGILVYQKQNGSLPFNKQTTQPAPSVAPWVRTDETDDWKIYTDQQFGIKFKYPSGIVQTSTSQPQIVLNNDTQEPYFIFTIKIADNPQSLTSKSVLEGEVRALSTNKNLPGHIAESLADYRRSTIRDYQSGIVSGSSMRWGQDGDSVSDSIEVVSINNNRIYTFMINDGSGAVGEFQKKLFDQILSTFKLN